MLRIVRAADGWSDIVGLTLAGLQLRYADLRSLVGAYGLRKRLHLPSSYKKRRVSAALRRDGGWSLAASCCFLLAFLPRFHFVRFRMSFT